MKARDIAKGRNRTRIRTKGNEGSIISFTKKTKGTSLGIA
jgi:hypothetical protein